MWNRMVNDPYVPNPDWTWMGTHTVIGTSVLPPNVTAETALLNYNGIDYFANGSTITLNHSDRTGYVFEGYTVNDADNCNVIVTETSGVYTFEMPAKAVTVTATWKKLLTNTDINIIIPSREYTSSELKPIVVIKDGSTELTQDIHYTVTLPDGGCTNVGDYTIIITGKGIYDGTVKKSLKLRRRK